MTSWTSYSALSTHRKCPNQWRYSYAEKLKRDDSDTLPIAKQFGTWWHAVRAADVIERGRDHGSLKFFPAELAGGDDKPIPMISLDELMSESGAQFDPLMLVWDALEAWWLSLPSEHAEQWIDTIGAPPVARLRYMLEEWRKHFADEIALERPLAVELKWTRKLPTLDGVDVDTELIGYIDEVYLDTRRNLIVARDIKTGKDITRNTHADDMMDSQLQFYAWGAASIVKSWGVGALRAVAYDRARTVAPKSPALTATGTLSKSVSDYDARTYIEWAAGPDGDGVPWGTDGEFVKTGKNAGKPKFSRYVADESVIEKLSASSSLAKWFDRSLTPLNANIVKTHLRSGFDTALDIQRTRERIASSGDAARNMSSFTCKFCDFVALCRAEMVGGSGGSYDVEDYGLTVKPKKSHK